MVNFIDTKIVILVKEPMQAKSFPRKGFYPRHSLLCALTIGLLECLSAVSAWPSIIGFDGLEDAGVPGQIVPDTNGAAGPFHLMQPLNYGILFQRKEDGVELGRLNLQTFWQGTTPPLNGSAVDPVVLYDPFSHTWFFTAITGNDQLLLAVSQTHDPTGAWWKWSVPGGASIDQPKMGINNKWIAVQVDILATPPYSIIFLFDKAPLLQGIQPHLPSPLSGPEEPNTPAQPVQTYKKITVPSVYGTYISPARTYDPGLPDLYLLQSTPNFDQLTINTLKVFKISGASAATAEISFFGSASSGPDSWTSRFAFGQGAPQPGLPNSIRADDDRIHSCMYRNGSLWTAQTIFLPAGSSPDVSAVQWWQISLPSLGVPQRTIIEGPRDVGVVGVLGKGEEAPSNPAFRAYPSLAVNANEDVLIGYSVFSSTTFPSSGYSFRLGTDAPGALQSEVVTTDGVSLYQRLDDNEPHRWGDYSAAVVDPINDRDMWTVQEYSGSAFEAESTRWATFWIGITKTFARFAGGIQHSFGQRAFGSLALSAAGSDTNGQLGNDNATASSTVPVGTASLLKTIDVAAGHYTNLAVGINGKVYAWGSNRHGLLGNGSLSPAQTNVPTEVPNLSLFENGRYVPVSTSLGDSPHIVSSGYGVCAAVDSLGRVWTWGINYNGQLGDGTTTPHYSPAPVKNDPSGVAFSNVLSIATGESQMVALKKDGTVWAWGSGCKGALGDGSVACVNHNQFYPQPVQVVLVQGAPPQPLTNVSQVVSGGSGFSLALTKDGKVYGWGANGAYQLGLGDTTHRAYATLIVAQGAERIAAGAYHSLARAKLPDGRVYAWGYNGWGQGGFGPGAPSLQSTPRYMEGTNSGYTEVAAGSYFSLMVRGGSEAVYGTGDNQAGQLAVGLNDTSTKYLPTLTQYRP